MRSKQGRQWFWKRCVANSSLATKRGKLLSRGLDISFCPFPYVRNYILKKWAGAPFYRTRVRSLGMLVTHSLTPWLPFSKFDWCDPEVWRCQLKTCWGCYCCWCWCWGSCWQQLIWELTFGHKTKLLFRHWAQGLVKILKLKFRQDFEAGVCSTFCCLCFVEVMKLNLDWDSEAKFGQDFEF